MHHNNKLMKKSTLTILLLLLLVIAWGQSPYHVIHYDERNGLGENTIDCIIQDHLGFIWIGTWDGLNRYDGYSFLNFKAHAGDRCPLANNRINFIAENSCHDLWCIVSYRPYLFRRDSQRFEDVFAAYKNLPSIDKVMIGQDGKSSLIGSDGTQYLVNDANPAKIIGIVKDKGTNKSSIKHRILDVTNKNTIYHVTNDNKIVWRDKHTKQVGLVVLPPGINIIYAMNLDGHGRLLLGTDKGFFVYTSPTSFHSLPPFANHKIRNICIDTGGNIWLNDYPGISLVTFNKQPISTKKIGNDQEEFIRALYHDRQGRLWIADKNGYVRIYETVSQHTAYLTASGTISTSRQSFGAKVYVIFQDSHNNVWIGTKPNGLYRLKPRGNAFSMEHFTANPHLKGSLNNNVIYDIKEDKHGGIWIATYGGGINKAILDTHAKVSFLNKQHGLAGYPDDDCDKVRCLFITNDGIMLAGTHGGLLSFDTNQPHPKFHLNTRHADDALSLSNNDVTQIIKDRIGRICLSTFGGGICEITSSNLLTDRIQFNNFTTQQGLPSDACISLCNGSDGNVWIVSGMSIIRHNPADNTFMTYSKDYFAGDFVFSEVQPLSLPSGIMMVGTTQGTLSFRPSQLIKSSFKPTIVFSKIAVEGVNKQQDFNGTGTLHLNSSERNISVDFAALDYNRNEPLHYAYMMEGIDRNWHTTTNHTANYMNMPPGNYRLHIRSTNGDGVWVNNTRTLDILVTPKFSETIWATLLYLLLMLGVVSAMVYIARYIYRLRHEIEDVQLAANEKIQQFADRIHELLSNKPGLDKFSPAEPDKEASADQAFINHLMTFVEDNISNSRLSVGDFAHEFCMSRTSLYRKLKETVGCTPHEFVSDMRIKRAIQLMQNPNNNISAVAYLCGFSDPRYFSRCFKEIKGCTPTEYMKGKRP